MPQANGKTPQLKSIIIRQWGLAFIPVVASSLRLDSFGLVIAQK